MPPSIQKDPQGPDWPLGLITVVTPGTPVGIMFNLDPNNAIWAPTAPTPGGTAQKTAGGRPGQVYGSMPEYTVTAQQILFHGVKGVGPYVFNAGPIYVCRAGVPPGIGGRTDSGSIVWIIQPGETFTLGSAAFNRNVFSPYRYYVDADNGGDGCLVTLLIQ